MNNEKHETTRKNFMKAALTASMRRTLHEIFSGHFVSFVVKKSHFHPVSLTHYSEITATADLSTDWIESLDF